jgi:preprotein translocase subunit SecA
VRDAEAASAALHQAAVSHTLLTAKHLEQEAAIISRAGLPGAVTVATNIAGRGTDILLGGPRDQADWRALREQALSAGGLFVLGAERNWTRRVDNQLAGRAARQGEPGEVQFFVSLEDEAILALAGAGALSRLARKWLGTTDGAKAPALSALVRSVQQKHEQESFSQRRDLLQYDKAQAAQRLQVYALREQILQSPLSELKGLTQGAFDAWAQDLFDGLFLPDPPVLELRTRFEQLFNLRIPLLRWAFLEKLPRQDILEKAQQAFLRHLEEFVPKDEVQVRSRMLDSLDSMWSQQLSTLEGLKAAVRLRAKAGGNPLFEFQKEAFLAHEAMMGGFFQEAAAAYFEVPPAQNQQQDLAEQKVSQALAVRFVGRNEPCPCGSGLPYKACHGKLRFRTGRELFNVTARVTSERPQEA